MSSLQQLTASLKTHLRKMKQCRPPTNAAARSQFTHVSDKVKKILFRVYAEFDSCDPSDLAIKNTLESLSDDEITFKYVLAHVASNQIQKKCIQTRNRNERKEHCEEADLFEETDWLSAFKIWGEAIEEAKTPFVFVLQSWTGKLTVKGKGGADLHCRLLTLFANKAWTPKIASHAVWDINDTVMGGAKGI